MYLLCVTYTEDFTVKLSSLSVMVQLEVIFTFVHFYSLQHLFLLRASLPMVSMGRGRILAVLSVS